jgi:hypothetical protein
LASTSELIGDLEGEFIGRTTVLSTLEDDGRSAKTEVSVGKTGDFSSTSSTSSGSLLLVCVSLVSLVGLASISLVILTSVGLVVLTGIGLIVFTGSYSISAEFYRHSRVMVNLPASSSSWAS